MCARKDNWIASIIPFLDKEKKCALLRFKNKDAKDGAQKLTEANIDFTFIPQTPISNITTETAWLYNAVAKFFILPKYSAYDFRDEIPNEVVGNKKILNYVKKSLANLDAYLKLEDSIGFTKQIQKLANYLGYDTKERHCEQLYETICDESNHSAFKIDELKRIAITFHSSKGLEFDQVILFASDYPLEKNEDIYNHYVAVTRAKSKLILLCFYKDQGSSTYVKNIKKILAESNLRMQNIATIECFK